jgi:hypothetical protein
MKPVVERLQTTRRRINVGEQLGLLGRQKEKNLGLASMTKKENCDLFPHQEKKRLEQIAHMLIDRCPLKRAS